MSVQVVHRRFTVKDYHLMAQAGILNEDDRVELIEGEIVEIAPIGSHHAGVVDRLTRLLTRLSAETVIVRIQNPILLGVHSEPQPDISLLRSRPDFYTESHPQAEEILLVIEVADSSIAYDRELKVPLYAREGISEIWVVDLARERVEVYRHPGPEGYRESHTLGRGERLVPDALPSVVLAVSDIFGLRP